MDQLGEATAALYEVFGRYSLKSMIACCPHCELGSAEAKLRARPLRQLTWDDLGVYVFKAMTTFGDEQDFKHFLPRILELFAIDPENAHYDLNIVFRKLEYASWTEWPEAERRVVHGYVRAWHGMLIDRDADSSGEYWEREELESALAESPRRLLDFGYPRGGFGSDRITER
jgi:hypothetical protein